MFQGKPIMVSQSVLVIDVWSLLRFVFHLISKNGDFFFNYYYYIIIGLLKKVFLSVIFLLDFVMTSCALLFYLMEQITLIC